MNTSSLDFSTRCRQYRTRSTSRLDVLHAQPGRRVTLSKRVVTIPPVSLTRVFQVDGRVVGYILFRQFVQPSSAALDAAFANFVKL